MLIAFRAENFKCFNQEISYSLISNEEDVNFTNVGTAPILNQISISGAPSTGKTATLEILKFIKEAVKFGNIENFPKIKPSRFDYDVILEVVISINKQFYCYGFSFNQSSKSITGEWINLLCSNGQSTMLYSRDDINFSLTYHDPIEKEDHKYFDIYIKDIKSSQLGLSSIAEHNCNDAPSLLFFQKIKNYLTQNITEIFSKDQIISTNDILNTPELCDLSNYLNKLDTGISAVTKEPCAPIELSRHQYRRISKSQKSICIKTNSSLIHIQNNEGQIETNEIKFCHGFGKRRFTLSFGEESSSNQRIIELALLIMNSKNKDNIFIVDNIDQALSQTQTNDILELLRDKTNDEEQQLIFTTSELFLPNENIFSFEQYWNTYRNKYEECYALQNENNEFDDDYDHDYYDDNDFDNDNDNDNDYYDTNNENDYNFIQSKTENGNLVDNESSSNKDINEDNLLYINEEQSQNLENENPIDSFDENNTIASNGDNLLSDEDQKSNTNIQTYQENLNLTNCNSSILPETNVDISYEHSVDLPLEDATKEINLQNQNFEDSEIVVPKTKKVRLTIKKVKDIIRNWNDRDINSQNAIYVHIRNNKIDITDLDTTEKINRTYIDMYDFLIEKEKRKKNSKRLNEYITLRNIYEQHIAEQINSNLINPALETIKQNIESNDNPNNAELATEVANNNNEIVLEHTFMNFNDEVANNTSQESLDHINNAE